ncbi:MAG: glycine betaine/L-proline ABC transporter ATP-binding protein [Roseovarius sp.]|nr:glycine betaine/L-proline ABC transporter ATP-binding protein [Roseovarius sp.]
MTETTTDIKIKIENVSKVFGPDPASALPLIRDGLSKSEILERSGHVVGIRNVSLDIPAGGIFVVMGLSGSGKSTLIRHINRLIDPTAGRIRVDGEDVLTLDAMALRELRRHKMSMVFQRFGLLPHRSVMDNVAYGLVVSGTSRKEARKRAERQIELVGLEGFEDHYPRQLSGGMQQRVGLARALATDAEILLMDEAFSALDPLIRNDMQVQMKELQERLKKTIVFITHDLDEALRPGDRIAILKDGELRQVGNAADILLNPADDYVTRFVRDVNRARVITVGSLAQPAAALAASELSAEYCRHALSNGSAAAVLPGTDGPDRVITRGFAERHAGESAQWWRDPDNFPAPRASRPRSPSRTAWTASRPPTVRWWSRARTASAPGSSPATRCCGR